jgi:hypothetical protein
LLQLIKGQLKFQYVENKRDLPLQTFLYKNKLTLHVDEVFNAIKILTITFIHDSFLQFMDFAYACGNHPKRHLYFQRPTGRRQLDGMNLKLVQRIGSCKLISKESSPHFS